MICIPIFGDQHHNAVLLERRGTGVTLQKDTLTKDKIIAAIRTIIRDQSFKKKAMQLSKLIAAKPMSSGERIIKFSEFAAHFDDTEILQTEGRNQSWIVLNSLDVILTLILSFVFILTSAVLLLRKLLHLILAKLFGTRKVKKS